VNRKTALRDFVSQESIVGVVRESSAVLAWDCAMAYLENGIKIIEITFTTPDAVKLIERLSEHCMGSNCVVAAGSIRSANDSAAARRAGAMILVSPHVNIRMIEYATEHDLLCIAGAATATEIVHAWETGADIIKVYPAPLLGGPDYIRALKQPLPDIPMLAGGPVSLEQMESYLEAGAVAVNLGGTLAVPALVAERDWPEIGRRVRRAVSIVETRNGSDAEPVANMRVH
jgi:2-dehydro-3-deoxyphosphogluconate aldolase / (4S)-4-hydroxy-2-oxoglutarate aldolase